MENQSTYVVELNISNEKSIVLSPIELALSDAESELVSIDETINSIDALRPDCDKLDYILACCSGALCGICDVFLVGKPGESPLGTITDKWFANRTMDFAKLCGWKGNGDLSSAIRFLEKLFKIPYDQTGTGSIAKEILNLTPSNHHFKSLAHNPSLLGLFFSILDQFNNTSHFVSEGQLITITNSEGGFELQGRNIPAKLLCAFVNWFGHLMSDVSGSSSSKGRGMGIPSPLWTWINDLIAIKSILHIPVTELDKNINELAIEIFEKGFDARFQTTQAIPVILNELIVRVFYAIRRLFKYYSNVDKADRSFKLMWKKCEPFSNPSVKRMLTVAHGTFCLVDTTDAVIRGIAAGGGSFNFCEFFLRLNIAGLGRFTISLYGEVKREVHIKHVENEIRFAKRERLIVQWYIKELYKLAEYYNDEYLLTFVSDFENSDFYIQGFEKTVALAEQRGVDPKKILRNKSDIDNYFDVKGR